MSGEKLKEFFSDMYSPADFQPYILPFSVIYSRICDFLNKNGLMDHYITPDVYCYNYRT
eukprot:IDg21224t1